MEDNKALTMLLWNYAAERVSIMRRTRATETTPGETVEERHCNAFITLLTRERGDAMTLPPNVAMASQRYKAVTILPFLLRLNSWRIGHEIVENYMLDPQTHARRDEPDHMNVSATSAMFYVAYGGASHITPFVFWCNTGVRGRSDRLAGLMFIDDLTEVQFSPETNTAIIGGRLGVSDTNVTLGLGVDPMAVESRKLALSGRRAAGPWTQRAVRDFYEVIQWLRGEPVPGPPVAAATGPNAAGQDLELPEGGRRRKKSRTKKHKVSRHRRKSRSGKPRSRKRLRSRKSRSRNRSR